MPADFVVVGDEEGNKSQEDADYNRYLQPSRKMKLKKVEEVAEVRSVRRRRSYCAIARGRGAGRAS